MLKMFWFAVYPPTHLFSPTQQIDGGGGLFGGKQFFCFYLYTF